MAFTRAQYRTRVLRRLDSEAAGRWDTTAGSDGEVDQVLGLVFDREWRRILNANRFYRMQKIQPTADADGRYALSALSTGSGDSQKRLYRILGVIINGSRYSQESIEKYMLATTYNTGYCVWYQDGQYVQALPIEANKVLTSPDGFVVNYIPTRIDNLSADNVSVDFPDGYEEIICLEAASLLMGKGGAELDTTAGFRALAESLRADMLSDIARLSTDPIRMQYPDNAADWAGM